MREEWDGGFRPGLGASITGSFEGLIVEEVADPAFEPFVGLNMKDVAAKQDKHIVDAMLDLVVGDNLQTEFLSLRGLDNPEYTGEVLRSIYVIPGVSDGGAHVKFSVGGSYPTETLTTLVRDEGVLSLEEAHHTLSYLPAFFGGFQDRGILREGSPADIVVYDLEGLELLPSEVAHDLPGGEWRRIQKAKGYR